MLISYRWLNKFLQNDIKIRELVDQVTMTGSHVDSVEFLGDRVEGIVVGEIVEMKPHDNADRLQVCRIDVGSEILKIVTAAKNVKVGQFVPVCTVGATLADGTVIGAHDFKGVISEGMLSSYAEMGFPDAVVPKPYRDGVLILQGPLKKGIDIRKVLELDDYIIDFEITPNRPDCLSVRGMAQEVRAAFGEVTPSEEQSAHLSYPMEEPLQVDEKTASEYVLSSIRSIEVKESPQWIQNNLMKSGIRPINNIVDLTNYVMLELGQPLHAFDRDQVEMPVHVRFAHPGETITTLDRADRELKEQDIVIADQNGAIAIGGVMGGYHSEVTSQTRSILLEEAVFSSDHIRKASKRLQLRSEASTRFEKGIAKNAPMSATLRFLELLKEIEPTIEVEWISKYAKPNGEKKVLQLRTQRVNQLLGISISMEQIKDFLGRLGLSSTESNGDLLVEVPGNRPDLTKEVDLIEEVGRLYGFHRIEPKPLSGVLTRGIKTEDRQLEDKVIDRLMKMGFLETLTYSFISPKHSKQLQMQDESEEVKILNPLGEDFSVMRKTLIPNMLQTMSKNHKVKVFDFRLFDLGNVFLSSENTQPQQEKRLVIGLSGKVDFYDLKAVIIKLLEELGQTDLQFIPNEANPVFHAGRFADILDGAGRYLGSMGEVDQKIQSAYDIDKVVYIAEIDLTTLKNHDSEKKYQPISKYPAITRDLALLVDKNISARRIEEIIKENASSLLRSIQLFDIYESEQLGSDHRSLAYQLIYSSDEKTLTEEEVSIEQNKVLNALENELGIGLRS